MRPPEPRRVPALDVKQFASRPGQESGLPARAGGLLEVTWEPPASRRQPADQVQSAELDLAVLLTEGVVETTANSNCTARPASGSWSPPRIANVSAPDRAVGVTDIGPAKSRPSPSRRARPSRSGRSSSPPGRPRPTGWSRPSRARSAPQSRRSEAPRAVPRSARSPSSTCCGKPAPSASPPGRTTRFVFKHGPDLRQDLTVPAPLKTKSTTAFFRLATGPTGNAAVTAPASRPSRPGGCWAASTGSSRRLEARRARPIAGGKWRTELKVAPIGTETWTRPRGQRSGQRRGLEPSPRSSSTDPTRIPRPTGSGKRSPSGPGRDADADGGCVSAKLQAAVRSRPAPRPSRYRTGHDRGRDPSCRVSRARP